VKFLLEQCNVPHNPKDRWGNTPLDEAETFNHDKVEAYLREYEAEKLKSNDKDISETNSQPIFSLNMVTNNFRYLITYKIFILNHFSMKF
jgi:ankyrin repeat protein